MGVFGMVLGLYLVVSHLAGLKSFGIPYLSLLRPRTGRGMWRKRQFYPFSAAIS